MRYILLAAAMFVLSFLPITSSAQQAPSQRELNGFLLGQYKDVLARQFGKPHEVRKIEDDWEQRVYFLDKQTHTYMIFEFIPSAKTTIYAMQISGQKGAKMSSFYGVKLGDSREAVLRRFGSPSETKTLSDIGGELLRYDEKNYSFEIDDTGSLSSIRLLGYTGFASEPNGKPDVERFAQALNSRDIDQVIGFLMPDVEITRSGKELVRFSLPARQELLNKDSEMYIALFGAKGSLRYALQQETKRSQMDLRVREDKEIDPVFKYPGGRYIKEIVFRFHAGRWRVWEVALK